jgi:hypothetical protein
MSTPTTWTTLTTSALPVVIGSGRDSQLNEWLVSEALASHLNDLYGRRAALKMSAVDPLQKFGSEFSMKEVDPELTLRTAKEDTAACREVCRKLNSCA